MIMSGIYLHGWLRKWDENKITAQLKRQLLPEMEEDLYKNSIR